MFKFPFINVLVVKAFVGTFNKERPSIRGLLQELKLREGLLTVRINTLMNKILVPGVFS